MKLSRRSGLLAVVGLFSAVLLVVLIGVRSNRSTVPTPNRSSDESRSLPERDALGSAPRVKCESEPDAPIGPLSTNRQLADPRSRVNKPLYELARDVAFLQSLLAFEAHLAAHPDDLDRFLEIVDKESHPRLKAILLLCTAGQPRAFGEQLAYLRGSKLPLERLFALSSLLFRGSPSQEAHSDGIDRWRNRLKSLAEDAVVLETKMSSSLTGFHQNVFYPLQTHLRSLSRDDATRIADVLVQVLERSQGPELAIWVSWSESLGSLPPALLQAVENIARTQSDVYARSAAFRVLARQRDSSGEGTVSNIALDSLQNWEIRLNAVRALAASEGEGVHLLLNRLYSEAANINEGKARVRVELIDSLIRSSSPTGFLVVFDAYIVEQKNPHHSKVKDTLLGWFNSEADPAVRASLAFTLLTKVEGTRDTCISLLSDQTPEVQRALIGAINENDLAEFIPVLQALSQSNTHPEVRKYARAITRRLLNLGE